MHMRFFFSLLLFFPFLSFAQSGNLTVFGDQTPFMLYVNDIQQNATPETHIRINGIPSTYITIKIIFQDPAIPAITRKNIGLADIDNNMLDVIYRLKKEKDGKIKFQFYGNAPAGRSIPDSITQVFNYRSGSEVVVPEKGIQKKETDKIIKKPVDIVTKDIKSETPLNIEKKKDPAIVKKENNHPAARPIEKPTAFKAVSVPAAPLKKCTGWPVAKEDFDKAKALVLTANSDDLKLKEAKSLASANCLMVSQVLEITELFKTEAVRIVFIKFAYAFTIDRQNYIKLKSSVKDVKNQSAIDELIKLR